jgi:hypothetical protein
MTTISHIRVFRLRLQAALGAAIVVAGLAPLTVLTAADDSAEKPAKTEKAAPAVSQAAAPKKESKASRKKLSGAELYSIHCNRCHPERYPTERTAAQWKTILLHMRVRANLPAEQSRTILTYLQDNSGR